MTNDLWIRGGSVALPGELVEADLLLRDGHICAIEEPNLDPPEPSFNAAGLFVLPGFVDLQVNGGWGLDLTSNPGAVWELGEQLPSAGVTAWLPTLVSPGSRTRDEALAVLDAGPPRSWSGAKPLGWHFEGPWLNPRKRGAHRQSAIRLPPAKLDTDGSPALVTLAPEIEGAGELIADLRRRGIVVSIGHTLASSSEVKQALRAGASMGTHLFNAMSGLDHHSPGAAAGLLDSDAWLGLIVDGHHVAPELVRLVWGAHASRVVLVSDAMAAAGLADQSSTLAGKGVTVANGAARLADGTLAGSVISMAEAVRNLVATTGCDLIEAVAAASTNPARALGRTDIGEISQGFRADFAVLDQDLKVVATFVNGSLVFSRPAN